MFRGGEDHPAGAGLEEPGHGHGTCADRRLAAIDNNHRAVIQEPNALSGFPPFLNDVER